MAKSSTSRSKKKSQKPDPDFPLTAHPSGRWCKKHRGKQYCFGPIDDWQAAYERFQHAWPYIIDGRTPPATDSENGCSVRALCNEFLNSKRLKLDAVELSERSFRDYFKICESLVDNLGRDRRVDDLRPADFERYRSRLAANLGTVSLKNERIVRMLISDTSVPPKLTCDFTIQVTGRVYRAIKHAITM